ncbi:MAG: hypothetical protein ABS36_04805 [Acidobacteria bacterium SCN 69-37]|nr:MAG: hypothetical protein ABS36_04805 [Acidobacteria bacterium SCN 69-37]
MTTGGARLALGLAALLCMGPMAAGAGAGSAAPRVLWQLAEPARGIPARDDVSAYFLTQDHALVAASLTSGRVRWRLPFEGASPTFGSRVIVRGDLVVAGDYDLVGVDRRTGRPRWTFAPADDGGIGMHLGGVAGDTVFGGSLAGSLHAVSLRDGRPRWTARIGHAATTTVYAPVVQGASVAAAFTDFGATPGGGVALVDAATGRARWRRLLPGSIGASGAPVFAHGVVVAASRDGTLYALDERSGAVRWTLPRLETLADEQDYRPLAVSGRTLVAGSLSGEIVAWDLVTQRERWRRTPIVASVAFDLAVKDDVVYVPYFSNQLVALRVRDGRELWRVGGSRAQYRWVPDVDGSLMLASGSQILSLFRLDAASRGER